MKASDVLRFQLNGSLNLVAERIEAISEGEWNRRAVPGTNKLGFILWHCSRIIDWTVHSALQGAAEVADGEPWVRLFPRHAYYGAGIAIEVADSVPDSVTRAETASYLADVRKLTFQWFDEQTDSTLDGATPLKRHQAAHPGYLDPPVWAEVASLDGLPAWQVMARPAISHVRIHIGEYDTLLLALRAIAPGVEA